MFWCGGINAEFEIIEDKMMKIGTEKTIAIAHLVQSADKKSPCRRLHGHNLRVIVEIEGTVKTDGMIVDFRHIKEIINELDHKTLIPQGLTTRDGNDIVIETEYNRYVIPKSDCVILYITTITAENLAKYLVYRIDEILDDGDSVTVTVYESDKSYATARK